MLDTAVMEILLLCVFGNITRVNVDSLTWLKRIWLIAGYSFSLTWITNSHGEVELLYRVLSLGTFERVAPEWMKETLMFSTSMCSVFFERVSRVIKS